MDLSATRRPDPRGENRLARPLGFLERYRARYGDTFTLRVRNTGTVMLLEEPEHIRRRKVLLPPSTGSA